MTIGSRNEKIVLGVALAAALAACGDGGGDDASTKIFVEDFVDVERIDVDATTAALVGGEPGVARAAAGSTLLDPGEGGDGDYAPGGENVELDPGDYEFSSFTLSGQRVDVDGDLTIRVSGPVRLTGGSRLIVAGSLTLVAGGPLTVDCAIVESSGPLVLHAWSDESVVVGCLDETSPNGVGEGTFRTKNLAGAVTGSIDVRARGSIELDLDGYFFSGDNQPGGDSGDVTLRAGGDVVSRNDSYVFSGDADGKAGALSIVSDGSIVFEAGSYAFQGSSSAPSSMVLHAGADLILREAWIQSNGGTDLELRAVGTVTVEENTTVYAYVDASSEVGAGDVVVQAGEIVVSVSGVQAGRALSGGEGSITLESAGDIEAAGSWVVGGEGVCVAGGAVTLRAAGDIELEDVALEGGEGTTDGGCAVPPGGAVTLEAGGAIARSESDPVGGEGEPAGTVSEMEGDDVTLSPIAAPPGGQRVFVQSLPLTEPLGEVIDAAVEASGDVRVYVTPSPGAAEVPLEALIGETLEAGWSFRAELTSGIFVDAILDRIELRTRAR